MGDLDHKKYKRQVAKIVQREVILSDTEKYIADNWGLLEQSEKATFKRMLGKAFDYILGKIDSRVTDKKEDNG